MIWIVCVRDEPWSGKSEAISTSGSPSPSYSIAVHDDDGSASMSPVPPPPPVVSAVVSSPPASSSSPPQPAATQREHGDQQGENAQQATLSGNQLRSSSSHLGEWVGR